MMFYARQWRVTSVFDHTRPSHQTRSPWFAEGPPRFSNYGGLAVGCQQPHTQARGRLRFRVTASVQARAMLALALDEEGAFAASSGTRLLFAE